MILIGKGKFHGKSCFQYDHVTGWFCGGTNDNPENGLGDGGDAVFNWYFSGDTEVPISDGNMVLKVSSQSAKLLKDAMNNYGAGVWGRRTFDIAHAWEGHPPGSPAFIVTHTIPQEWVYEGSPFTFVTDGWKMLFVRRSKLQVTRMLSSALPVFCNSVSRLGLMDEIHVDVAPMGDRRWREFVRSVLVRGPINLECMRAIQEPNVIHLGFRVVK